MNMSSDHEKLDLEAAEDFRRQRQAAQAKRTNVPSRTKNDYLNWFSENADLMLVIAKRSGASDEEAPAILEHMRGIITGLPDISEYDDPGGLIILTNLIRRVEDACKTLSIPTKSGVAFGVMQTAGLIAQQERVLATEASIIQVTWPLITFCDLISKLVANTVPHTPDTGGNTKYSFSRSRIFDRLMENPWLVREWFDVMTFYAVEGTPPPSLGRAPDGPALMTRALLLDAMEAFVIAHEYGHHVLNHGESQISSEPRQRWDDEYEADLFARFLSPHMVAGKDEPAIYLASGAGAASILGALNLWARIQATLKTGNDVIPQGADHPPIAERMSNLDIHDKEAFGEQSENFIELRRSIVDLFEIVWEVIKPDIEQLHHEGVRPSQSNREQGGWLPFANFLYRTAANSKS